MLCLGATVMGLQIKRTKADKEIKAQPDSEKMDQENHNHTDWNVTFYLDLFHRNYCQRLHLAFQLTHLRFALLAIVMETDMRIQGAEPFPSVIIGYSYIKQSNIATIKSIGMVSNRSLATSIHDRSYQVAAWLCTLGTRSTLETIVATTLNAV